MSPVPPPQRPSTLLIALRCLGAVLLLLLSAAALWAFTFGSKQLPLYAFGVVAGVAALIMLTTTLAAGRRGTVRRVIFGIGAAAVVAGLVGTVAVPAVQRRVETQGDGVRWRSPLGGSSYQPVAKVGDALLILGSGTLLFVALADGTVRRRVSTGSNPEIIPAGDQVVVETNNRYQLYDAAGTARWPDALPAEGLLARRDGVTVLRQCDGEPCTLTGYDDAGRKVWQRPGPRSDGGLHHPDLGPFAPHGLAVPPDRLALRERSGYGWRVLDAATGKELGFEVGHAAHLTAGATIVLRAGSRPGTCQLTIDAEALGGRTVRTVDCRDTDSSFVVGRMLVVPVGAGAAQLHRLDRDAEPVPVAVLGDLLRERPPYLADEVGIAALTGDRIEARVWPAAGPAPDRPTWTSDRLRLVSDPDLDPELAIHFGPVVGAGTIVIAGTAEVRGLFDDEEDSMITVFDLASGTRTARVRIPQELNSVIFASAVLPVSPGCAAAILREGEVLLLGRC
ncbi:hypothetical protein [Microlunatus sp. GCM10028923]|uniref:hypothetical protein n=1 Tax=Microlunatus sp. GCM10028923 TaxID=3273400 RepID=UPI00361C3E9E